MDIDLGKSRKNIAAHVCAQTHELCTSRDMYAYISHTHIHINMHKNTQTKETLVIAFLPGICVCEPNKYS